MDVKTDSVNDEQTKKDDDESIDTAMLQMEIIYKSRCIQPALGSNVTIREIEKDK